MTGNTKTTTANGNKIHMIWFWICDGYDFRCLCIAFRILSLWLLFYYSLKHFPTIESNYTRIKYVVRRTSFGPKKNMYTYAYISCAHFHCDYEWKVFETVCCYVSNMCHLSALLNKSSPTQSGRGQATATATKN